MRLKDIKKGQKCYWVVAGNDLDRITGRRIKVALTVYILEVDTENKKVCGSLNKGPAKWDDKNIYFRWKKLNPEKVKSESGISR